MVYNFTVNILEILTGAHAIGTSPFSPLPWPGYKATAALVLTQILLFTNIEMETVKAVLLRYGYGL